MYIIAVVNDTVLPEGCVSHYIAWMVYLC